MTRKPKHPFSRWLPLTYKPKIQGVLEGTIVQSIRIDTDLKVGDFVAFHGWSGTPYHSHWSFRTPFMPLNMAMPVKLNIKNDAFYFPETGETYRRPSGFLNDLAALDGIDPPTTEELVRILRSMHGKGTLQGKILRWDPALLIKENAKKKASLKSSQDFIQIGDIEKQRRDNPAILQ